jgi:hypothetical protein
VTKPGFVALRSQPATRLDPTRLRKKRLKSGWPAAVENGFEPTDHVVHDRAWIG